MKFSAFSLEFEIFLRSLEQFTQTVKGEKWYFVTKIVLTYCEKKNVLVIEKNFEAEGREFAKILISLEQFIQTVKGQNNFW